MEWNVELLTEPIEDRDAWERDCAMEVRSYIEESPIYPKIIIEDIRRDGSYPDTQLVVLAERPPVSGRREFRYDLWGPDFEIVPGRRDSPNGVGGLISMWIAEDL